MVEPQSIAERERCGDAEQVDAFQYVCAVALLLGVWLWLGYGIGRGAGWMHAKLFVVLLAVGYHHACAVLLRRFAAGANRRGHRWYRWFNEVPILLMTAAVLLAVLKPF